MNELSKLDPKDYGLEESSVATIEQAFQPKIIERDALIPAYEELIAKELSPELCKDFHALRLKCVKVRTGIADVHKTQKAYFLAAGRFVDAWKNKETLPIEQMEEKLKEGEEYFERIEAKRIADLEASRTTELSVYTDLYPNGLGLLSDASFAIYLSGAKVAYETRVAAEAKAEEDRVEVERLAKEEQERIRTENERLKKEAEEKLLRDKKRNDELLPFIVFIRDYAKMLALPDDEYVKEFADIKKGAELQWEFDRKEQVRIASENEAKEKALAAERKLASDKQKAIEDAAAAERKKSDDLLAAERADAATKKAAIEAELKAVQDAARIEGEKADESLRLERLKTAAFESERQSKIEAERKLKAATDIEKLKKLADDIDKMEMPEIGNPAAAATLADVKGLLTKTTKYLREKIAIL